MILTLGCVIIAVAALSNKVITLWSGSMDSLFIYCKRKNISRLIFKSPLNQSAWILN